MTALWVIGGVGLGILVISLVFDGLLDACDLDFDGVPVVTSLSAFAGAFGLSGASMIASGISPTIALSLGVLTAVVAVAVIFFGYRLLRSNAEQNRDAELSEVLGQMATVTTWGIGSGEIMAMWAGSTRKMRAQCTEEIKVGQEVQIIEIIGNNVVKVRTYK